MICFLFQKAQQKPETSTDPKQGKNQTKSTGQPERGADATARRSTMPGGQATMMASQLNEHATNPSFAHAPAKIEQPPCQPEGSMQPTQNETISARQAPRLGRTGVTRAGPSDMIKRGMFLTTKPNASLSHTMNQHDPQAPRAKSKHQC